MPKLWVRRKVDALCRASTKLKVGEAFARNWAQAGVQLSWDHLKLKGSCKRVLRY